MSSSSTQKSTSRKRKQRTTPHITFRIWQDGGETDVLALLPRTIAENTRVTVSHQQQDGTWKSCELQYATMVGNVGTWVYYHPSPCHQSLSPENDGLRATKLSGFARPQ